MIKIIVVMALLLIVASLASALYYMVKDLGDSTRLARALTIRVGLSLLLFGFLILAFYFGWINPHAVIMNG